MGATHVWYTGVIRHATAQYNTPAIVKGKAGSPYAITDYYDIDPDLCEDKRRRMQEFTDLVERSHKANLQVIIDFVPNHVAREYHSACKPKGVVDLGANDNPEWAFSPLNNFYYMGEPFAPHFDVEGYQENPARATGNDCFTAHPSKDDWYETVKLNYGVFYQNGGEQQFDPIPDTWHKMLHILLFWASKGIDGFRCDMAEMVPEAFWTWAIAQVKEQYPDMLFIAEVYNPERYRAYIAAGFDYLYDKVGMYDYLRGVTSKNWAAEGITQQWQAVDDIRQHMLYFLENHDEQRIASDFFAANAERALAALIISATIDTQPFMLYAGQELGERGMDKEGYSGVDGRTTIFDYWSVDTLRRWKGDGNYTGELLTESEKELQAFYSKILNLCNSSKALQSGLFYGLQYANPHCDKYDSNHIYSYLRGNRNELLLIVTNFSDCDKECEVTVPEEAFAFFGATYSNSLQKAKELISDKETEVYLNPIDKVAVTVPANSGIILEFKL